MPGYIRNYIGDIHTGVLQCWVEAGLAATPRLFFLKTSVIPPAGFIDVPRPTPLHPQWPVYISN